MERIAENIQVA